MMKHGTGIQGATKRYGDACYHFNFRPLIHLNKEFGYYWLSTDFDAPDIWLCLHDERVYDQLSARALTLMADSYRRNVGEFPMTPEERDRREEHWFYTDDRKATVKDIQQFNEEVYFSLRGLTRDTHPRGTYSEE